MAINARATTFTFGTARNDIMTAQYLLGDMIDGGAGDDTITGSNAEDTLVGGAGRDTINGQDGHDVIDGGAGNDRLFGGLGNDQFRPDTGLIGNDFIDGGDGLDLIDYGQSAAVRGVQVNLSLTGAQNTRGAGTDTIRNVENLIGTKFNDNLTGSALDNFLTGNGGADTIDGGAGNDNVNSGFLDTIGDTLNGGAGIDSLTGAGGADKLNGGADADRLTGGAGADILTGGTGADRFVFNGGATDSTVSAPDRITDFNGAEDIINLALSFSPVSFIGAQAFTGAGIEVRATGVGSAQLVEVSFGGDTLADMAIKVAGTNLVADDFSFGFF